MPDTTSNTEQQETAPVAPVVEATPVEAAQPPAEPEEDDVEEADDADDAVEGEEGEEVPRTEFMNLKDALIMGQKQLQSKQFGNASNLKQFLIMDLYPILIEITDFANWYVGDLHNRVMGLEMNEGGDGGEALSPETAEQLINFIGMSLQIFGVILQSPKADPKLIQVAQILTAQAPGLIAKVQEITMSEEDEEDEDYEDEDYEEGDEDGEDSEVEDEPGSEPTEVLEPRGREPVQAAPEKKEEPNVTEETETTPVSDENSQKEEPVVVENKPVSVETPVVSDEPMTEEAPTASVDETPQPDGNEERSDG